MRGGTARIAHERHSIPFEVKLETRTVEHYDQVIENLEIQYHTLKQQVDSPFKSGKMQDVKKILNDKAKLAASGYTSDDRTQFALLCQIYQQTLASHFAEVNLLKSQLAYFDKNLLKAILSRISDTFQENKGHLKLFQNFVLDLIKIQGDSLLLDSDRIIKTQMSISHIQQAATRISFDRIDKDLEALKSLLQKLNPVISSPTTPTEDTKDVPIEAKYFQQLEKIRMENEILQNKTGVLEATIQEVELNKATLENPSSRKNSQKPQTTESQLTVIEVGMRDPRKCARILAGLILGSSERKWNGSVWKIQEMNKRIIRLLDEVSREREENGMLRQKLLKISSQA